MLGWALKRLVLCGAASAGWLYFWNHRVELTAAASHAQLQSAAPVMRKTPVGNSVSFTPDRSGHVFLDVFVNGTSIPCMIDTGATFVALSSRAAQAAGIALDRLHYTARTNTANGQTMAAPVSLRDVRISQLALEDVDAFVLQTDMNVCLLGQSFLKRLDGYEVRDGAFVMRF
jgi:aspartyl protease family protein